MTDYSVYLVTDSSMVPSLSTFLQQVERSVANGATIVQLREKSLATRDFIAMAAKVHTITKKAGIPLIINDRVDVALAIGAEGIHVGQDDMDAATVRRLMGPDAIVGVTCSTPAETERACADTAAAVDYLGLGTVFPTATKKDTVTPEGLGPIGMRKMLKALGKCNEGREHKIKCVAIGGINQSNAGNVMFQCRAGDQALDGVAVVSCVMAAEDAGAATAQLAQILKTDQTLDQKLEPSHTVPMVHHITNNVVKNFSANVTLAMGGSPIMSELAADFDELAGSTSSNSLVINLGTPDAAQVNLCARAVRAYNSHGRPVVVDPVACGALAARLAAVRTVLNAGRVSVIKGNFGEILAVWSLSSSYDRARAPKGPAMRGVDSVGPLDPEFVQQVAREVAVDFRCVVVVTGKINYIADEAGTVVDPIPGGHAVMGSVTGTGCSLGSAIGVYLAQNKWTPTEAARRAISAYNRAGAAAAAEKLAPGSFAPAFIDKLYELKGE